jgi:UDPglucose 6-dehydrogenase
MMQVSVVGLGKLGACMAACIASKGFSVIGVDVNPVTLRRIQSGEAPVVEPGLAELMAKTKDHLTGMDDYSQAVLQSSVTFIVVPTPSEEGGGFSLRYVKQAAREIGRALRKKNSYHLVVLTSTVLPGSSAYGVIPLLEQESGKRCGEEFGFCYGPEFIALGSVIRDFLNPDFVLIGQFDQRSGEVLESFYRCVCENKPPVSRLGLINAELAKISVNTYVTMKITFANMIAALCEQLPGGDIDAVTSALGLDSRIGPRYLKGALGYGGPCFPRDNLALAFLARQVGMRATLAEATDTYNRTMADSLVKRIASLLPAGATVAVLGLSYKPETCVVEESQALYLAQRLASAGVPTIVYDPLAMENARQVLGRTVKYADSLEQCVREANALVLATPDKEFARLGNGALQVRSGQMVFDAWRMLRGQYENNADTPYFALGIASPGQNMPQHLEDLWSESLQRAV